MKLSLCGDFAKIDCHDNPTDFLAMTEIVGESPPPSVILSGTQCSEVSTLANRESRANRSL